MRSRKEIDDIVRDAIPGHGIGAQALADYLAWPLSRVAASLRRMERQGRVQKLQLDVPSAVARPVFEWHPIPEHDDTEVEDALEAILLVNPHGLTLPELAQEAGYSEDVTGAGLARLQDACRVQPLQVDVDTLVWLAIAEGDR